MTTTNSINMFVKAREVQQFLHIPGSVLSQVVNAEIVDGFLKDVCTNNYAEESV